MQMSATDDDLYIAFGAPTITPKHYIVKGPSGWTETFPRVKADAELAKFISPLPVADAIDLFITQRELSENKTVTEWFTIVGFIGRTMGVSPKAVPHLAGIALWAQVLIAQHAKDSN